MARLSESKAGSRNALAFLDMLSWAEGTSISPATAMDGYDVIVTGIDRKPEVFKDFTDHPYARGRKSKVINSKDLTSNASGRYQQMLQDWPHYRALLKLPDFSPISQDLLALHPFDGQVHVREYSGEQIMAALEHAVSGPDGEGPQLLQVAGLTYTADTSRPSASPIRAATSLDAICALSPLT